MGIGITVHDARLRSARRSLFWSGGWLKLRFAIEWKEPRVQVSRDIDHAGQDGQIGGTRIGGSDRALTSLRKKIT